MKKQIKRIGQFIFDVFLPPRCLICHTTVQKQNGLCPKCFAKIHFLTDQSCPVCGRPYTFPVEDKSELICGKCLTRKPKLAQMKAVFAYDDFSRGLILPLKHADMTESVPFLADMLLRRGGEMLKNSDCIIPVPLHWRRLIKRKYNQSALLANALAARVQKPCFNSVLIRSKNTPSQGHKTRKARKENVKDAFMVKNAAHIKGKTVLLIDDVYTTGITLNECARALKSAGAKKVNALTLSRICRFE